MDSRSSELEGEWKLARYIRSSLEVYCMGKDYDKKKNPESWIMDDFNYSSKEIIVLKNAILHKLASLATLAFLKKGVDYTLLVAHISYQCIIASPYSIETLFFFPVLTRLRISTFLAIKR